MNRHAKLIGEKRREIDLQPGQSRAHTMMMARINHRQAKHDEVLSDEDLIWRLEKAARDRDGNDYGHAGLLREAARRIQFLADQNGARA